MSFLDDVAGALAGGVVGSAIGGGIGSIAGGIFGGTQGASGLTSAIGGIFSDPFGWNAQQSAAEQQLAQANLERGVAMNFAQATPQELAAQSSQLSMANDTLKNAQDQMGKYALMQSQISPTFADAFSQIQGLLQGQQVGYTSPYFQQLEIQRQQMNNNLQQTMGTGYGSSSAGIQAQALFAQQAGLGAMDVTQNALSTLSNLGTTAANMNNQYLAALSGVQGRQIAASEATSVVPYQGANQVSSILQGNAIQSLVGGALGIGSNAAGSYASGYGTQAGKSAALAAAA